MNCYNSKKYNDGFNKARKIISETQKLYNINNCCLIPNAITGPTGPTGPAGENGLTPNFSIGTVTTGAPGTNAAVTIKEVENFTNKGGILWIKIQLVIS